MSALLCCLCIPTLIRGEVSWNVLMGNYCLIFLDLAFSWLHINIHSWSICQRKKMHFVRLCNKDTFHYVVSLSICCKAFKISFDVQKIFHAPNFLWIPKHVLSTLPTSFLMLYKKHRALLTLPLLKALPYLYNPSLSPPLHKPFFCTGREHRILTSHVFWQNQQDFLHCWNTFNDIITE